MNRARRDFLSAMCKLAALIALPRSGSARTVSWNPQAHPFDLGVASGSPSADGFVLWTRILGRDMPPSEKSVDVSWEVFDLDGSERLIAQGKTMAMPALGHSVHVEVNGLTQDRWYGYRFRVGKWVSPTGRTRTLPSANVMPARLRFAYASCQSWESGWYSAYRHMREEDLDLVVFVGDYIYEGASSKGPNVVRRHNLRSVRNLADYRARYAKYKSDPLLQAMHAQCPWLTVWDDHEVQNNYAGSLSMYQTRNFPERRAAAYQAYYEHMPLRASTLIDGIEGMLKGSPMRIHDRIEFGRLATFHLLDCRQFRDAPLCTKDPQDALAEVCVSPDTQVKRSMLGADQERWLDESLARSAQRGTVWNLIVQQNRFTPGNYRFGPGLRAVRDTWDGYPEARSRLLASISTHRPRNPVFIGGDLHQNWAARVHQNPYDVQSPVLASEFVGTSISSPNRKTQEEAERHAKSNPHCLLSNTEKRGYGVVELDATTAQVALRIIDDVRDPDSGISTLGQFVIGEGQPLRRVL